MNGHGQMEVHYINTGFPYTVTESFMNFFEGLTHVPAHYGNAVPMHDQVFHYLPLSKFKYVASGCSCVWQWLALSGTLVIFMLRMDGGRGLPC